MEQCVIPAGEQQVLKMPPWGARVAPLTKAAGTALLSSSADRLEGVLGQMTNNTMAQTPHISTEAAKRTCTSHL